MRLHLIDFIEIVKLLIDAGADLNIYDNVYNTTALMIAKEHDHKEIVKLIEERIEYLENLKKLIPEFIKATQDGEIKNCYNLLNRTLT